MIRRIKKKRPSKYNPQIMEFLTSLPRTRSTTHLNLNLHGQMQVAMWFEVPNNILIFFFPPRTRRTVKFHSFIHSKGVQEHAVRPIFFETRRGGVTWRVRTHERRNAAQ